MVEGWVGSDGKGGVGFDGGGGVVQSSSRKSRRCPAISGLLCASSPSVCSLCAILRPTIFIISQLSDLWRYIEVSGIEFGIFAFCSHILTHTQYWNPFTQTVLRGPWSVINDHLCNHMSRSAMQWWSAWSSKKVWDVGERCKDYIDE